MKRRGFLQHAGALAGTAALSQLGVFAAHAAEAAHRQAREEIDAARAPLSAAEKSAPWPTVQLCTTCSRWLRNCAS